nr:uncharacterized protein LOC128780816 [Desmodus rotundus]
MSDSVIDSGSESHVSRNLRDVDSKSPKVPAFDKSLLKAVVRISSLPAGVTATRGRACTPVPRIAAGSTRRHRLPRREKVGRAFSKYLLKRQEGRETSLSCLPHILGPETRNLTQTRGRTHKLVTCIVIVLFKVRCSTQLRPPLRFYITVLLTVLFLLCAFPLGINMHFLHYSQRFYWPDLLLLLASVNSSANPLVYYFVGRIGGRRRGKNLREVFQKALGEESALRRDSSSGAVNSSA